MIHNEAVAAWRNNEGVGAKKEEINAKSEAKLQFKALPSSSSHILTG